MEGNVVAVKAERAVFFSLSFWNEDKKGDVLVAKQISMYSAKVRTDIVKKNYKIFVLGT